MAVADRGESLSSDVKAFLPIRRSPNENGSGLPSVDIRYLRSLLFPTSQPILWSLVTSLRTMLLIGGALLCAASTASAQDPFELEVYTPRIASPGEWELGINTNYVATGSTVPDGPFAPTDRQTRTAIELGHGLNDRVEIAAYALTASRPGQGLEWAGWRLRARVRSPVRPTSPFSYGVNVEVEATNTAYGEHEHAVEVAPIIAWTRGRVALTVDAPFARALGGNDKKEWEFEPKVGFDLGVTRTFTFRTMYFNSPEDAGGTGPEAARRQMLFPGGEFLFGDDFHWNFGVGFGMSKTADDLVLRTGVEFPLHE